MGGNRTAKKNKLNKSNMDVKDDSPEGLLNRILDEKEPFEELLTEANEIDYEALSSEFVESYIEKCIDLFANSENVKHKSALSEIWLNIADSKEEVYQQASPISFFESLFHMCSPDFFAYQVLTHVVNQPSEDQEDHVIHVINKLKEHFNTKDDLRGSAVSSLGVVQESLAMIFPDQFITSLYAELFPTLIQLTSDPVVRSDAFFVISKIFEHKTHLFLNKANTKLLWSCLSSSLPDSGFCIAAIDIESLNSTWKEVLSPETLRPCFEHCTKQIETGNLNSSDFNCVLSVYSTLGPYAMTLGDEFAKWLVEACHNHIKNALQFPLGKNHSLKEMSIVNLVKNKISYESVPDDLKSDMQAFLSKDSENRFHILEIFLNLLTSIVGVFPGAQNSAMDDLMAVLDYFYNEPKNAEWLDFFSDYFVSVGTFMSNCNITEWGPQLTRLINFINECILLETPHTRDFTTLVSAATGAIGDVTRSRIGVFPSINTTIDALFQVAERPNWPIAIRKCILDAFGDIALSLANQITPHIDRVIKAVERVVYDKEEPREEEQSDHYQSICEALTGIIQGLRTEIEEYVPRIFEMVKTINDKSKDPAVKNVVIGVVGDLFNKCSAKSKPFATAPWLVTLLKTCPPGVDRHTYQWTVSTVKKA